MLNLTQNNFEQEVINSDKIVVVKYTATWCTPCKALNPIFKELYKEINNVKFAEIDIDMEEKLAQKYMVRAVPCIIIFKDGKEVNRIIGYQNKEYLKKEILKNM
ncbi:thioredoxin [Candidatus Woesearchaeota archaeon]|nr:thioredoxin [Candidatus Woesearchaeota archaeon]